MYSFVHGVDQQSGTVEEVPLLPALLERAAGASAASGTVRIPSGPESSSVGGSKTSGWTKAAMRALLRVNLLPGGVVSDLGSLSAPTSEGWSIPLSKNEGYGYTSVSLGLSSWKFLSAEMMILSCPLDACWA